MALLSRPRIHPAVLLGSLALLTVPLAGCEGTVARGQFIAEFNRICAEYLQLAEAQAKKPLADLPQEAEAKARVLAESVRKDAAAFDALIKQAAQLNPPPGAEPIQKALVDFLNENQKGLQDYAKAIESGSTAKVKEASRQMDEALKAAHRRVQEEAKKLTGEGWSLMIPGLGG